MGDADSQSHPYRISSTMTGQDDFLSLPLWRRKRKELDLCFNQQFPPNLSIEWNFNEQVENDVEGFLPVPITEVPEYFSRDGDTDQLAELQPQKNIKPRQCFEHPGFFQTLESCSWLSCSMHLLYWPTFPINGESFPINHCHTIAGKGASHADDLSPISLLFTTSKMLKQLVQCHVQDDLQNFDVLVT